jgi:hypothetical protein
VLKSVLLGIFLAAATPAQVAILQIQVVEGEGTVHAPGARSSRPLTVEVTDETGKPVTAAAVSFHLPEDGPGGTFASGLRTDVATTDARGRATIHTFQANRIPGRFQIRIIASKEQARAGTVSFQYVAEFKPGAAASAHASHTRRWLMIGAVAGGGAVAALLAGRAGTHATASVANPAAPVFNIGNPSISVGKP